MSDGQQGGYGLQVAREVLVRLCRTAFEKLPDDERINRHWHPEWRGYVRMLKSLVSGATNAENDKWGDGEIERFIVTLNALSMGLSIGYGMGLRDGTGVVFFTVPLDQSPGDPHGCGPGPTVPEGASCSLRCTLERSWCLCREGCGQETDCSWPCFSCIECNLGHAICAADCIFNVQDVPPGFANPRTFTEFAYPPPN